MEKVLNEEGRPVLDLEAERRDEPVRQQQAVATQQHFSAPTLPTSMYSKMLEKAVDEGKGPEVLDKLNEMHLKWEMEQFRRVFIRSLVAAKAEIKPIVRNRLVKFDSKKEGSGKVSYTHEDLAAIEEAVVPALSKYGLMYTFEVENELTKPIKVTCVLEHELGHARRNTLYAPPDSSGSKNFNQANMSTITYLKRYSLNATLGLSATEGDVDNDGATVEDTLSSEQVREISDRLTQAGAPLDKFLKSQGGFDSLADMPANRFEHLKGVIANWVAARDRLAAEQKAREEQQQRAKSEEGTVRDAVTKAKPRTMI